MTFVLQTLTVPVLLKAVVQAPLRAVVQAPLRAVQAIPRAVVQIPTRPAARVKALNQAQTAIWVNPPAARVLAPSRTH